MVTTHSTSLAAVTSSLFDISNYIEYTAISIKVAPEQSGKVEYEREKLAGSDD